MKCKFPSCERPALPGRVWCSDSCSHAGRQANFNGEPTGRRSVYRRLNARERSAFRAWLKAGGRLTE